MATLVFTAVGTALGGPIGGAIGSMLGQSIDQQLFGSRNRGPRLGDLAVQTSSYGTQIPKIYGTMRVAGSVAWATDLKESSAQTGAKGQPDTTVYSYSVSLAVALSSRPIRAVKRIWADGKLIRGKSGKFKVKTKFRLHLGEEDQDRDPLIASVEGVDECPAYRGLAMAVFEDLELADFGNRIPFLTFEVEADAAPPTIAAILEDASDGAIDTTVAAPVQGYAAHGPTVRAAIEPLVEHFSVELFDDGLQLRGSADTPLVIGEDALGNSATEERVPRIERMQKGGQALPVALALTYYDPSRDYLTGQMRATVGDAAGAQEDAELAIVLTADAAKALVESELARRWAQRDRLTLRLPPRYIGLRPGAIVSLPMSPAWWTVERCEIEAMVAVAELRPTWGSVAAVAADPGRPMPSPDVVLSPTKAALFDLPSLDGAPAIVLCVAAASAEGAWRGVPIELKIGAEWVVETSAARESILGRAMTSLGGGQAELFDLANSFDVELVDSVHWLTSCDDDALVAGANLAVVGSELIQFGSAIPLGPRQFRLSRLLRGRRGTEWAMGTHSAGESFALLAAGTTRSLTLPNSAVGSVVEYRPAGLADADSVMQSIELSGEGLKPPAPVHLRWSRSGNGDLKLSWIRRSRYGWAWLDETDAPLGESREIYRVTLSSGETRLSLDTSYAQATIAAADLGGLGSNAQVTVQQIGDFAASRPLRTTIQID